MMDMLKKEEDLQKMKLDFLDIILELSPSRVLSEIYGGLSKATEEFDILYRCAQVADIIKGNHYTRSSLSKLRM